MSKALDELKAWGFTVFESETQLEKKGRDWILFQFQNN